MYLLSLEYLILLSFHSLKFTNCCCFLQETFVHYWSSIVQIKIRTGEISLKRASLSHLFPRRSSSRFGRRDNRVQPRRYRQTSVETFSWWRFIWEKLVSWALHSEHYRSQTRIGLCVWWREGWWFRDSQWCGWWCRQMGPMPSENNHSGAAGVANLTHCWPPCDCLVWCVQSMLCFTTQAARFTRDGCCGSKWWKYRNGSC